MATLMISLGCQRNSTSSAAPSADATPPVTAAPVPTTGVPAASSSLVLAQHDPTEARNLRNELVAGIATRGDARDAAVLKALRAVPRHLFAPGVRLPLAYADQPLLIGYGQTISQPTVVAVMTEALALRWQERVLEIGTGSGYQAAVLSLLAREVYSIEIVPELGETARRRLEEYGYANVHVRVGDGYRGWPEKAPFDRIIVTAAPPEVPQALAAQLAEGGLLVAPIGGQGAEQTLYRYEKRAGHLHKESLALVRFVPMVRGE